MNPDVARKIGWVPQPCPCFNPSCTGTTVGYTADDLLVWLRSHTCPDCFSLDVRDPVYGRAPDERMEPVRIDWCSLDGTIYAPTLLAALESAVLAVPS